MLEGLKDIVAFFNHPFFIVMGGVSTVFIISGFIATAYWVARGALPLLMRLGIGLSKRKIAVFVKKEHADLVDFIVDSGIFRPKNVIGISPDSISKAKEEKATIYLVYWEDFQQAALEKIIQGKEYSTALIVYVPHGVNAIGPNMLERINKEPNSTVVRFRGRLLNDILTSVLTTSYIHKR